MGYMKELMLNMSDGINVYVSIREPAGKAIGHIHRLHGMAEHSGRYDEAADFVVSHGYIVTAHDHRVHGKTAAINGKRGHFGDELGFDRVVQDVFEVVTYVKNHVKTEQFILIGHSMGSFIARRFIQ